ncbi:hypothetical protein [Speluncibacter jeojiensis]|uniref:EcsC family protein n=1 Tax=Speluncibacter jeojiensis TaxID=2710754 RepID=A0A9X4M1A9_9ACTN|nr:hypothetical protein [Corynebacteriales bacterium D3-21]
MARNWFRPTGDAHPLLAALDKGIAVPTPVIVGSVARIRRAHPDEPPALILARLEKRFLDTVTSSGAAVGAAAAIPAAGTGTALAAVGGETAFFMAAAALLTLSIAEVYGLPVEDVERRRTLVLAVALGDSGTMLVQRAMERFGNGWLTVLYPGQVPGTAVRVVNSALVRKFALKVGTKQGLVTLGKLAPMGIGAVVGAGGNRSLGHVLIRNARKAFGPPPANWPTPGPPAQRPV